MYQSLKKRKSVENSDDSQNKRRRADVLTASTSTSIHSNQDYSFNYQHNYNHQYNYHHNYNNLRTNWRDDQTGQFKEEIEFAKHVCSTVWSEREFNEIVTFLLQGAGNMCMDVLRRNKIKLSVMSSILEGSYSNNAKVKQYFFNLYDLWFDREGNKTKLLKTFEEYGFSVNNISEILSGSGSKGAKTLVNLYELWFDNSGNPSKCLKILQNEGINSSNLTDLLRKTGDNCIFRFNVLHTLWFNPSGTKTYHVKNLEAIGIDLLTICGVLRESGHFSHFYRLWFNENAYKTTPLKNFERIGLSALQVCDILKGTGKDAVKTFENLYHLWFNAKKKGRKTLFLKTLESEQVDIAIILDILVGTGIQVASVFQELHGHWFHRNGDKTYCLQTLEARGKRLPEICRLLIGEGSLAVKKFTRLFNYFDSCKSPLYQMTNQTSFKREVKSEIPDDQIQEQGPEIKTKSQVDQEANTVLNIQEIETKVESQNSEIQNEYLIPKKEENTVLLPKVITISDEEDFKETIEVPGEEKKEIDVTQLKNKINFFYRLIPSWNKGNHSEDKMRIIIKETSRIVNDEKLLSCFLQSKVQNKLISQKQMKDILDSLTFHGPFTTAELEDYLEIKSRSLLNLKSFSNENLRSICARKFAKTVFAANTFDYYELLKFLTIGNERNYIQVLIRFDIVPQHVAKMFIGCNSTDELIEAFRLLYTVWFDENEQMRPCLCVLANSGINLRFLIFILSNSGIYAAIAFQKLYNFLFDARGNPTCYLDSFRANGLDVKVISQLFENSGLYAAEAVEYFHDLCFDTHGRKSRYLTTLETENIHLHIVCDILKNSGMQTGQIFQELYNLWFDFQDNKTERLRNLEKNGVNLIQVAKVLHNKGEAAPEDFKNLCNFVFDEMGNKRSYLTNMEKELDLETIFGMIGGQKTDVKSFENLCNLWFDAEGNKTDYLQIFEDNGVSLKCLSGLLNGSGVQAYFIFNGLIQFLFDERGNKTKQMKNIEKVITLRAMFELISGTGHKAYTTFVKLYNLWFDSDGKKTAFVLRMEKNEQRFMKVSRTLVNIKKMQTSNVS